MSTSDLPAYLAFDLGATSGRAILGRLEDHRMHMEELHRFPTPIIEDGDRLYWDLDVLWQALEEGLERALQTAANLRSLSVDAWGVDYVPLDDKGTPLRPAYCYRDSRTQGIMEWAFARIPAEAIYAETGIQFMPINTLYQVLADRLQEPALYAQTRNRLTIADYFNYRFSGTAAVDASIASTTQLMDVRTRDWSTVLTNQFDLQPGTWPDIVPCGSILGPARRTESVQVVASCSHDTGCAVASVPARTDGGRWAYISCGTWSLLGVERREPLLEKAARQAGFTNEAGIDGTIRFLKNLTGLWALQECVRTWREDGPLSYDTLLAEAREAAPPFARINLEDPRFLARGDMEARILDYCREHNEPVPRTRGALTRAILESIAESYRRTLSDLEQLLGYAIDTLYLVGGGSRNTLLCQLTADACGRTVVAGPAEATALGNLLIQARTMGDLPAGYTIRDVVQTSSDLAVYAPNKQ